MKLTFPTVDEAKIYYLKRFFLLLFLEYTNVHSHKSRELCPLFTRIYSAWTKKVNTVFNMAATASMSLVCTYLRRVPVSVDYPLTLFWKSSRGFCARMCVFKITLTSSESPTGCEIYARLYLLSW